MAEVTYTEWITLRMLARAGRPVPMRHLTADQGRGGYSHYRNVKSLESKGFVKITHSPRGDSQVEVTSAGRDALRRTNYTHRERTGF